MFQPTSLPRQTKLLSVFVSLYAAVQVACYFIVRLLPEDNWLSLIIATVAPLFILPLLPLLAWTLIKRDWVLLGWNTVAAAFCLIFLVGLNIPMKLLFPSSGHKVRVMTYNVRQGQYGSGNLARVITRYAPDILCLQEVDPRDKWGDPVEQLSKLLHGRWYVVRDGELAIFSRHRILDYKVHHLSVDTQRDVLEAIVRIKDIEVAVFTTHFNIAPEHRLREAWSSPIPLKMDIKADATSRQAHSLIDAAKSVKGPAVIAGDLNIPPQVRAIRRIAQRYPDAFQTAGWGLGYTIRSNTPVERIDYIFTDKKTAVSKCFVPSDIASDHLAVVADIHIAAASNSSIQHQ